MENVVVFILFLMLTDLVPSILVDLFLSSHFRYRTSSYHVHLNWLNTCKTHAKKNPFYKDSSNFNNTDKIVEVYCEWKFENIILKDSKLKIISI